jgi:AraC family transcriptional regulator
MQEAFAALWYEDGVLVRSADVNGFEVRELRFPPGFAHGTFEPELPYLAVVLEGEVEKSFPRRTIQLNRMSAVAIPAGAAHAARFGSTAGARIVTVTPKSAASPTAVGFDRVTELRDGAIIWLASRLAGELRAPDAAAPLAAAGLALELLAATRRQAVARGPGRAPAWLSLAEELLRAHPNEDIGLGGLAAAVGVHPSHLARRFRAHHGLSVGEYSRRLRLAWAASEVGQGHAPLAKIAAQAGFADQSHFTRLFRRYIGTTPARYRRELQSRHVPGHAPELQDGDPNAAHAPRSSG